MPKGTLRFPNGDTYEGQLSRDGKAPEGKGVYNILDLGISFSATWPYDQGPVFDSIRLLKKPKKPTLLISDFCQAYYNLSVFTAVLEANVGDHPYGSLHFIHEKIIDDRKGIKILEASEEKITFQIDGTYDKDGKPIVDSLNAGEKKTYLDTRDNFVVYADEEVEYTETYRLEVWFL